MIEITIFNLLLYASTLLCLGSFAALFSIRWPRTNQYLAEKEAHEILSQKFTRARPKSISFGRSQCMHCLHSLSWKDTIPLISFVLLRGQCRYCSHSISSRYWAIEALFLIVCLPLFFQCSGTYQLLLTTLIISSLLMAAIIDYEHQLIPNECCGLAIAAAFFLNIGTVNLNSSVLGAIFGYGIIYLLRELYLHFRNTEGIGLGDAKLLAVLGAWLYVDHLFTTLLYASLLGILYTAVCHKKERQNIPFGPFLTLSGIVHFYYIQL